MVREFYFKRQQNTFRAKKPEFRVPKSGMETTISTPTQNAKGESKKLTKFHVNPWSKDHEHGEYKHTVAPHQSGRFSNKNTFKPHRDLSPDGSPRVHTGTETSNNHPHQPDYNYRHNIKKDENSKEQLAHQRETAQRIAFHQALRDAFLGEKEFEAALASEQSMEDELDYIFNDDDAWADWQSGERFDGAQPEYDDTRTNSFEYSAGNNEEGLRRVRRMEQSFIAAQSYRRPQNAGRVQMTSGNTNKPVPERTPKYLYKK